MGIHNSIRGQHCRQQWAFVHMDVSINIQHGICSSLSKKCLPRSRVFKRLVPSCWCCLGRFRKCGLTGGSVSLREGFERLRLHSASVCSLCFMLGSGYELWASYSASMLAVCHASAQPSRTLILLEPWTQINSFFCQFCWSWLLYHGNWKVN